MRCVAPSPELAPFVAEVMIVEVDEDTTRLRLPEPGLVLGVRYRGSASWIGEDESTRLPDATLTGMTNVARSMRTAGKSGIVLARFRAGGAAAFVDAPLHDFFGATLALDEIVPRSDVDRVTSRIGEATSDAHRAAALEAFLLSRFRPRRTDPIVGAAARALEREHGALRIADLAKQLAISQDRLEKRFRRVVGATPKQFASLLRLRRAIDAHRPGASLAQLALGAGYFDQSHFHRELRAATGRAPAAFFREGAHR